LNLQQSVVEVGWLVGLKFSPDDAELTKLGITNFAMEDFLIKLLSLDKETSNWAEITNDELRNRSQALKDKANLKAFLTPV
jgi:hypothetical protein